MKSLTTISIDTDVIIDFRARNEKLSPLINDFLKEYLEIKKDNGDSNLEGELVRLKSMLSLKEKELKKIKEKEDKNTIIL
tara:strand:+ start:85 stop:324 length:240 start_codon:yes stop_codon:yes gene_type:complete